MNREDICVLVVDDTDAMRFRVKDLLTRLGFKNVTTADGPTAGMEILNKTKIHLILSDWNMEPVDGKAFLMQIRGGAQTKDLPFVMVTAESTIEKVSEAIILGVDDYLVKPFSQEQLEAKLQSVLKRRKLI